MHLPIRTTLQLALVLPFLLFIATGCPKDIPPPDNAIDDVKLLRSAIETRTASFETARFKKVVLDYYGNGDRVKVKQLVLVAQPSYLRVQTRVPASDEILNLLVSDGETFAMHKRDSNEFFTGPANEDNIGKLLPVDLSARDVSRVMLGGAPWDRFDRSKSEHKMSWDRAKGMYRYHVARAKGGVLSMWIRHTDFAVTEVEEKNGSGDVIYSYTTDDWKRHGNRSLPEFRRFVWPERDLDFSMDVGETQIDIDLPDILFELEPPAGSRIIQL